MDKILKKIDLETYLKNKDYKYDIDDIYNFYLYNIERGKILPHTPIKLIKELERRALILDCSLLEYIKYDKNKNMSKKVLNGDLDPQIPLTNIFDITNNDKLVNLELKCFIVANYNPFDKNELNKCREKIKSYNCFCKNKNCMSILKQIKQPKLAEYKHFNEDDHEYVKRINYYFLDQYYDSHSKAERITLSKMLANKVYLQNKIKLLHPNNI